MKERHFYFVADSFYKDFPDPNLMRNKEAINGIRHDRPCFFAITDKRNSELFWFIPISSRVDKYKDIYAKKVARMGKCNTICFAEVMGAERAFLIQNMFPITQEYVTDTYIDRNTSNPVTISDDDAKRIIRNARDVLKLYNRGMHNIIFPKVDIIREKLIEQTMSKEVSKKQDCLSEKTPFNDFLVRLTQDIKDKATEKDNELER